VLAGGNVTVSHIRLRCAFFVVQIILQDTVGLIFGEICPASMGNDQLGVLHPI